MTKHILGLDLGTNSIGWALVEIDHENKMVRILGLGSRILTMDAAEIAKFESGAKTESTAAKRTTQRSSRKLNERYLLRRDRLHCVLNLLNALPEHYKLAIEFENEKGKRSGKFKKGTEEKLAYYKDDNGKFQFLFKDAYYQMENDFKKKYPEMFYRKKNGNETKIPYDWTLYYLRHKAVTDKKFELTKEQLAWITLSFNQKRGYEKVIGQDEKAQKEGELRDGFVGKVKSINKIGNEDVYEIILVDNNNEAIELFKYKEETKILITEIGDLKEVEIISKYDEEGTIDTKKTEYIINEVREFTIVDVRNTRRKIKENFVFEIELETGWVKEQQSKFTPKWKDTKRDFIIKTKYDKNGNRILKGTDKGRNINIPKEEDWTLMKLKIETSLTSFNTKNNTKGVASFVYYNLLQNPKQKIKADLITVIERDYYRDELDVIYKNQEKFHPELKNRNLYKQAIQLLYPNNTNHQKTIKELDFNHLIKEDILLYQRDLKSKKSLITDCVYEKENFERTDEKTGKKYKNPLKAIHKANPLYQEFRLWQFIKRLKIIKKENIVNDEIKLNIDVTSQLLTRELKEELYAFLNDKESVTEKDILGFLNKRHKDLDINSESYKWNFASEKEPCNPTRYNFILRTKRIKGFDYRAFLTPENEYSLWHFFYSVKKKDEFNKGLTNIISRILDKSGLSKEFHTELVKNFSSFGGYSNDYGTYSEKAIKKMLPFLRLGKYWNEKDVETILSKANQEVKQKVLDKEEINGELKDFQGLWFSSACYLVYGRYSEVGEVQFWQSPYDIENYLKNEFRQHSLNNPVVEKVLVETLHVVKDIWKYFGEEMGTDGDGKIIYNKLFDRIHIELGREMKKNNKQKEKDDKNNKENRKANERIVGLLRELKRTNSSLQEKSPFQQEKLRILEESLLSSIEYDKDNTEYELSSGKITKKEIKEITTKELSKVSRSDFERYKLWLDQRYQSPYTGKFIKLSDLFDRKKYEIEHIFPQERITLNALYNKVICETEINKEKKALTGYGFIANAKSKKVFCAAHDAQIEIIGISEYEELVNNNFSGKKREILLSKEIPEEFTNSQLNNSQYIAKMAMKLLSNVVREKDEDTFRSKNVLATNGTITTTLKRHWQLNDAWNELISPRFKRLNELTNSNLFGDYREINGHKVFINTVPEEASKNFDPKRIDHRHHALDALVIALTTENHVQYLNNI
ncbi:type II CRISPR RNA-guided endonuclease Cas9, partial [Empedobacter brevis]|uniref:type II CRISPR RNA-guided endonuclease Cas9 n=1 Tax=Empedobacter brevis TaxID=247 RepID=UPI002FDF5FD7